LPFSDTELQFFDELYTEGKINASLLTDNAELIEKIHHQPLLQWKAQQILKNSIKA